MPAGHTDRATINQRKPMSRAMEKLLRWVIANGKMSGHKMDQADKSRARALMDRGYMIPDAAGWWDVTDAGRAAAAELK